MNDSLYLKIMLTFELSFLDLLCLYSTLRIRDISYEYYCVFTLLMKMFLHIKSKYPNYYKRIFVNLFFSSWFFALLFPNISQILPYHYFFPSFPYCIQDSCCILKCSKNCFFIYLHSCLECFSLYIIVYSFFYFLFFLDWKLFRELDQFFFFHTPLLFFCVFFHPVYIQYHALSSGLFLQYHSAPHPIIHTFHHFFVLVYLPSPPPPLGLQLPISPHMPIARSYFFPSTLHGPNGGKKSDTSQTKTISGQRLLPLRLARWFGLYGASRCWLRDTTLWCWETQGKKNEKWR